MKKVIGIFVAVIAVILLVLAYFGLFAPVKISEDAAGPFWLVYEKHTGDYKNVGTVMDRLYYDLKKDGIETFKGFGIYYDNPKNVDKDKLRSVVGCILDGKDENKTGEIKKKFNIIQYPASKSVICKFPFKGMPSIVIGIIRVYPKLFKYMKDHNYQEGPIMELYDEAGGEIQYMASINIEKSFFDSLIGDIKK